MKVVKENFEKETIIVYTDGATRYNGKPYAIGGFGAHFPNGELPDISEIFNIPPVTNQRTELYAIHYVLREIRRKLGIANKKIIIKTDSEYSINCVTKWIKGWEKNGWKTQNGQAVKNSEVIIAINNYIKKYDVEFVHVKAHTGEDDFDSVCNDKADKLAKAATNGFRPDLTIELHDDTEDIEKVINKKKIKDHVPDPKKGVIRTGFNKGIRVELMG